MAKSPISVTILVSFKMFAFGEQQDFLVDSAECDQNVVTILRIS